MAAPSRAETRRPGLGYLSAGTALAVLVGLGVVFGLGCVVGKHLATKTTVETLESLLAANFAQKSPATTDQGSL